jgi:hypothetical protein
MCEGLRIRIEMCAWVRVRRVMRPYIVLPTVGRSGAGWESVVEGGWMERIVERSFELLFFLDGIPRIEAWIWSSEMCVPGPGESLDVEERDWPGRARFAMRYSEINALSLSQAL